MKFDNVDRCVGGTAKFDDKLKKGATEGYGHAALVRLEEASRDFRRQAVVDVLLTLGAVIEVAAVRDHLEDPEARLVSITISLDKLHLILDRIVI